MNNCFIKKEYYFSLKEVVEYMIDTEMLPYVDATLLLDILSFMPSYMGGEHFNRLSYVEWDSENNTYTNLNVHVAKMFDVMYARFYKHGFMKLDHAEILTTDKPSIAVRLINLLSLIEQTYPRYKATLDAYSSQAQTLLAKIKSTSGSGSNSTMLNKHNDTPQNVGSWDTDTYTTDVNKTTTESQSQIINETDKDTPIMRLNEIQTLYRNLIKDWTDEMERCFYEIEIE